MAGTSSHLLKTLTISEVKDTVDVIAKAIARLRTPIHALAMTGISSVGLTIPVSLLTNIPVIYIRKLGEDSHGREVEFSPELVEEYKVRKSIKKVGFIDDLIASGCTVDRVQKTLENEGLELSRIFLYENMYHLSNYNGIVITNCCS